MPQTGFVFRLDPRTRLILATGLTLPVFAVTSLPVAGFQFLTFLAVALASGLRPADIFPRAKFLAFLVLTMILLQMLFRYGPETRFLVRPLFPARLPLLGGRGAISLDGLIAGLVVAFRILGITALMSLSVLGCEPRLLAWALAHLGLGYRAAFAVSSALNLVASFRREAGLIMDARRLRGLSPVGPLARIGEYRAIALPLMVKLLRRSLAISLVMDSRAFGAHETRTWLLSSRMGRADCLALVLAGLYSALVLVADRLLGPGLRG